MLYNVFRYLGHVNFFIWAKLFKRKIFLEAIDKLGDYYNNQFMTLYEDVAMLFVVLSIAKIYVYLMFLDIFIVLAI